MDFTIDIYKSLINELNKNDYSFTPFRLFLQGEQNKIITLRHDVDLLPQNSLRFAKIQNELGISGSYYFRAVPESWDEKIIQEIESLGHEVGYHYENMDTAYAKLKDKSRKAKVERNTPFYDKLLDIAYEDFCINLDKLRKLVPVSTICMHGSPRSLFDNKELWKKYDYKSLSIIGEPYYDVNFDKVFYLTDTGRRWDGWKTSVRDKVPQQEEWIKQGLVFHSTQDIIRAVEQGTMNPEQRTMNPEPRTLNPELRTPNFPNNIMFTMHPQRWHDKQIPWLKEFVMQNVKNQIKKILIKTSK